jgi:hypothetical protein
VRLGPRAIHHQHESVKIASPTPQGHGPDDRLAGAQRLRALTHFGPQRKAALRFIFTKSLSARLQTQPFFPRLKSCGSAAGPIWAPKLRKFSISMALMRVMLPQSFFVVGSFSRRTLSVDNGGEPQREALLAVRRPAPASSRRAERRGAEVQRRLLRRETGHPANVAVLTGEAPARRPPASRLRCRHGPVPRSRRLRSPAPPPRST